MAKKPKIKPFLGFFYGVLALVLASTVGRLSCVAIMTPSPASLDYEDYARLHYAGPTHTTSPEKVEWQASEAEKLVKSLDFPNNKKYKPLFGSYFLKKRYDKQGKILKERGHEMEGLQLAPLLDKDGKPMPLFRADLERLRKEGKDVDPTWDKQICFLHKAAAEAATRANLQMYKETGGQINPRWCYRPVEQQAIMVVRSDPGVPVGAPGKSWHQGGNAMDVKNFRDAYRFLKDEGFVGVCDQVAKEMRDDDKGHFTWGVKPAGLAQSGMCKAIDMTPGPVRRFHKHGRKVFGTAVDTIGQQIKKLNPF